MPGSSVPGRAAKREAVRRTIGRAAVELFLHRGFQQTTIDDVAAAANVSRRTYFRYFGTKDEALFAWVDDVGSDIAAVVAGRPHEEPTFTSLRRALDGLVDYAEQDVDRIRRLKALASPAGLFPALGEVKQGSWSTHVAGVVAARSGGATDAAGAALQVNVAFLAFDWARSCWLADPARTLGDLVDVAFRTLQRGFS